MRRTELLNKALAAGYEVKYDFQTNEGHIVRRRKGSQKILLGVTLYPDGTAIRADLPIEICTTIRTNKAVAKLLGICT